jgi:hypothetical protein
MPRFRSFVAQKLRIGVLYELLKREYGARTITVENREIPVFETVFRAFVVIFWAFQTISGMFSSTVHSLIANPTLSSQNCYRIRFEVFLDSETPRNASWIDGNKNQNVQSEVGVLCIRGSRFGLYVLYRSDRWPTDSLFPIWSLRSDLLSANFLNLDFQISQKRGSIWWLGIDCRPSHNVLLGSKLSENRNIFRPPSTAWIPG